MKKELCIISIGFGIIATNSALSKDNEKNVEAKSIPQIESDNRSIKIEESKVAKSARTVSRTDSPKTPTNDN